jgi:hypothetical protein
MRDELRRIATKGIDVERASTREHLCLIGFTKSAESYPLKCGRRGDGAELTRPTSRRICHGKEREVLLNAGKKRDLVGTLGTREVEPSGKRAEYRLHLVGIKREFDHEALARKRDEEVISGLIICRHKIRLSSANHFLHTSLFG